jgi:hypothetical protein
VRASPRPSPPAVGPDIKILKRWREGTSFTVVCRPKRIVRPQLGRKEMALELGDPHRYAFKVTRIKQKGPLTLIWVVAKSVDDALRPHEAGLLFCCESSRDGPRYMALAKIGVRETLRGLSTESRRDYTKMSSSPFPVLSYREEMPIDFPLLTPVPLPAGRSEAQSAFRITEEIDKLFYDKDVTQTVKAGADLGGEKPLVPVVHERSVTYLIHRPSDHRYARFVIDAHYPWPVYAEGPSYRAWLAP